MASKRLTKLFYDPSNPASFSTLEKLYDASGRKIKKSVIQKWLQKQKTYTLHKPKRKRFKRNFYNVNNIADLWQTDLICWESLANHNDGYKYILVVIDVFSKFAYVVPLKSKTADSIIVAFKHIFDQTDLKPLQLSSDKGGEYRNKKFQKFMKNNNIRFDVVQDDQNKSSVAERFIRTITTLIHKYFTAENTLRYVDVLKKLTHSYNHRKHRSIGMAPVEVNETNILKVYENLNKHRNESVKKPKCKVGDYVRVSKNKHLFEKNFTANYSHEVFIVDQVILRKPIVYKLKDLMGEEISGIFYEPEVQKVIFDANSEYLIDKIIETRSKSGRKQSLVRWKGWPEKFNSWVDTKLIKKIATR
jgi:Integrase core domain/Chromo (CHRromatin Organisation MOdifier) domain